METSTLVRAIAFLRHITRTYQNKTSCVGWHYCHTHREVDLLREAESFILKQIQNEMYADEITSLQGNIPLQKQSSVYLSAHEKHPILVPGRSHIALLLTRHFHQKVQHQGGHFTEGAIRSSGFWITGGKRLVSKIIYSCVKCKRLRGKLQHQKMSDLPADRLSVAPPFSFVGVDTFGPWHVVVRRTRAYQAENKRWAVLFTCLSTRSIHIEVIEELSSSSFINGLRRFISIKGHVIEFRSDRGTNFIGAVKELGLESLLDENGPGKSFLRFIFSPYIIY